MDRRLRQLLIAGIAARAAAGRINDAVAALAGGLVAGAWAVGYGTSIGELALMGAITGLPLGTVQAFLLRDRVARSWVRAGRAGPAARCHPATPSPQHGPPTAIA